MAKKRNNSNSVNQIIERISNDLILDKYCKHWGEGDNEIWEKYKDLTLDKYLRLTEQEQERIKTYMKDYYCPVEYLHEKDGKVYIVEDITWNDILSCKKGTILSFNKDQKRLIEKCRKSPKYLVVNDYLPF